MATIQLRRSSTPGHQPSSLAAGEIAINTADGIVFWLDADGTTIRSFNLLNTTFATQTLGDSSSKPANTAFVAAALTALIGGAPSGLNTLGELADAVNNDPTFWNTIQNALSVRLRFDAAQSLSGPQQVQGQTNLGIVTTNLRYDTTQSLSPTQQAQAQTNLGVAPAAQFNPSAGRFVITSPNASGASQTVAFMPYNGNYVKINGLIYQIPVGGVTANISSCYVDGIAGQSLVVNKAYYVFVWNNGGTLALDFSLTNVTWTGMYSSLNIGGITSHAPSTTTGNIGTEVKYTPQSTTYDDTRSLVGLVIASGPPSGTTPNPCVIDSTTYRYIASWFNRRRRQVYGANSTPPNTWNSGGVWTNMGGNVYFTAWADSLIESIVTGYAYLGNFPGGVFEWGAQINGASYAVGPSVAASVIGGGGTNTGASVYPGYGGALASGFVTPPYEGLNTMNMVGYTQSAAAGWSFVMYSGVDI